VPLPFVGHEHADGALLGVALVLPRHCAEDDRRAVLQAIARFEAHGAVSGDADAPTLRLLLGQAGTLELERVAWGQASRKTLRAESWTRLASGEPARHWASATPVALDRNPGQLHDPDPARRRAAFAAATDDVRTAVIRVFPEAARLLQTVDVVRSCVLPGTTKPRDFPRFPISDQRPQSVHIRLVFTEPVLGPRLVGAGRYQGLGLCLPVTVEAEHSAGGDHS
jgi:CRISPR-associated protein Csb2